MYCVQITKKISNDRRKCYIVKSKKNKLSYKHVQFKLNYVIKKICDKTRLWFETGGSGTFYCILFRILNLSLFFKMSKSYLLINNLKKNWKEKLYP